MSSFKPHTKRGYTLSDCASILQKSIRRSDAKIAGYFGQEMVASGFHNYVWKRLLTVSAEDCHGIITQEISALKEAFDLMNKPKKSKLMGRIFISKAIIILCQAPKSRDADHLQCLVYDKKISITDEEIQNEIEKLDDSDRIEIPEYAFDVHTRIGRQKGKTKKDFFNSEQKALKPLNRHNLFDKTIESL